MQTIGSECCRIVAIEFHQGFGEPTCIGKAGGELICFELMLARPPCAQGRKEKGKCGQYQHEQQQRRMRRGNGYAQRGVEIRPRCESAQQSQSAKTKRQREKKPRAHMVQPEMPELVSKHCFDL